MKRIIVPIIAAAALFAGCSSAPAATPSASESPFTQRTAAATAGGTDKTADVQKWAGDNGKAVSGAVEEEPGRFKVSTTIADPRGKDGSDEAKAAIAICQAVRSNVPDVKYIRVDERDGSAFVLWQPGGKVGNKALDECTEV